jgi:hypothetical protein
MRLALVDGTVTVDLLARLPGRGAYLCHQRECIDLILSGHGVRGGKAVLRRALHLGGAIQIDEASLRAARQDEAQSVIDAVTVDSPRGVCT